MSIRSLWKATKETVMEAPLEEKIVLGFLIAAMSSGVAVVGKTLYNDSSHYPQPRPVQYRDVNKDGIEDKITERREQKGAFWPVNYLERKVSYGVVINGRRVYLSEATIEGLRREGPQTREVFRGYKR